MIAVIFEVVPAEGRRTAYLARAELLRPLLEEVDGFLSIERFESLSEPGKVLSLSFWQDEEALAAWRRTEEHRQAQEAGRAGIFADYRLRGSPTSSATTAWPPATRRPPTAAPCTAEDDSSALPAPSPAGAEGACKPCS